MIRKLNPKLVFPLVLCLGMLLLMVRTTKVEAVDHLFNLSHLPQSSMSTVLLSESFDYPDGTVIDHEVTTVWSGR